VCVVRGYWFSGSTDVKLIREKIDHLCPASEKAALKQTFKHVLEPFTWTPTGHPYAVDKEYLQTAATPASDSQAGSAGERNHSSNSNSNRNEGRSIEGSGGRLRALRTTHKSDFIKTDKGSGVVVPDSSQTFKMVIYQVRARQTDRQIDRFLQI
jgi:hypothetical protein